MSKLINQPSYSTRPTLRVDLPQIRANYEALKARVGAAKIGASVKADAYGLGAVPVAKICCDGWRRKNAARRRWS